MLFIPDLTIRKPEIKEVMELVHDRVVAPNWICDVEADMCGASFILRAASIKSRKLCVRCCCNLVALDPRQCFLRGPWAYLEAFRGFAEGKCSAAEPCFSFLERHDSGRWGQCCCWHLLLASGGLRPRVLKSASSKEWYSTSCIGAEV